MHLSPATLVIGSLLLLVLLPRASVVEAVSPPLPFPAASMRSESENRIWPLPEAVAYGSAELQLSGGAATSALPWQVMIRTRETASEQFTPGPALSRALAALRVTLNATASSGGHAFTSASAAGVAPRFSFVLEVASPSEELVDAVDESYTLTVNSTGVVLVSPTVWGARHGLNSLAQLVRHDPGRRDVVGIRHVTVQDAPQYQYRGLMVSPGQRFITPDLLTTILDGMEMARMNVLHFHLSEFCRYAIESKAFPALSANLSSGLNKGFYTWNDINKFVAQAKLRGIRVIPEYHCHHHHHHPPTLPLPLPVVPRAVPVGCGLCSMWASFDRYDIACVCGCVVAYIYIYPPAHRYDVPGHQGRNMGLLPEMKFCTSRPPAAAAYQWELFDDAAGSTFAAVAKLYHELIALFPDKYFHVRTIATAALLYRLCCPVVGIPSAIASTTRCCTG